MMAGAVSCLPKVLTNENAETECGSASAFFVNKVISKTLRYLSHEANS
jgi:hypothetical protein